MIPHEYYVVVKGVAGTPLLKAKLCKIDAQQKYIPVTRGVVSFGAESVSVYGAIGCIVRCNPTTELFRGYAHILPRASTLSELEWLGEYVANIEEEDRLFGIVVDRSCAWEESTVAL
jgi:hypothetical protein